jgi:hypothetical protein
MFYMASAVGVLVFHAFATPEASSRVFGFQGRLRPISLFNSDRIESSIGNDLAGGLAFIEPTK